MTARAIQYLHLEFLQLFRLCKERNYVNRKRKTPVSYTNRSDALNCCKRLIKFFLEKTFAGHSVSLNRTVITIKCNKDEENAYYWVEALRNNMDLMNNANACTKINTLWNLWDTYNRMDNNRFCSPTYPRPSIDVHICRGYYNRYAQASRLPFRFYEVALAVLEIKQRRDRVWPKIAELTIELKAKAEEIKSKKAKSKKAKSKSTTQTAFDRALSAYREGR